MARRSARRRPAPKPVRRASRPRPAAARPPVLLSKVELREPPHAHGVCRSCGRIVEVDLLPLDAAQLTALASGSTVGWAVEGISLSLTGLCPRCQQLEGAR